MKPFLKNLAKRVLSPFNLTLSTTINGQHFKVPIIRGIGASNLNITERWMIDALRRLLSLAPDTAFLDIGVNLGQTLLKLKSLKRDIHYIGFEPNAFCVQYVNQLIRLNNLPDCELIPIGLAEKAGLMELIADSEADTAASIIDNLRPGKTTLRRQHIPVFALDEIAAGLITREYQLIKIDVEGAELEVISGMRNILLDYRPWILCEVLHAHSEAQLSMLAERNGKLMQCLNQCGYRCFRILKNPQQTQVIGLEAIDAFGQAIWNPHTSPAVCDYVFVAQENVAKTQQIFATGETG